jgi:hypothetical protein
MPSAGHIKPPTAPKIHPAAVQKARIRLPEGQQSPADPSPFLPTVGKI